MSNEKRQEAPVLVRSRQKEKGGYKVTERNVNVDYCGIVNLLRHLVKNSLITEKEARKIAARIAVKNNVDIVLFL